MDLSQIRELLNLVAASNVAEVEIEEKGVKIVVRKNPASVFVQPSFLPSYPMAAPPAVAASMPVPPTPYEVSSRPVSAPEAAPSSGATGSSSRSSEADTKGLTVKAPIVGTFYRAPGPDKPDFVKVGDTIKVGDVLCIIEAMKLMNEIESEVSGRVRQILVQNGEPVEYDQGLFIVDPL